MDPFSLAASIVVPDINVRAISDFIYRSGDSEHNLRKSDERRSRSKSREKDEKRGRSKSPARLDLAVSAKESILSYLFLKGRPR